MTLLKEWWWVVAFVMASYLCYLPLVYKKNHACCELKGRLATLEAEMIAAQSEKEMLMLRIASQDDPCWIEQMLMRALGVVPEGQIKVHFHNQS